MSLSVRVTMPERGLDLALELPAGETSALVGPNGAGKSSVLGVIAGTLRPRTGRVELDGRVLADVTDGRARAWVPPHSRHVTTLTQDPVLFPHLTVAGNILFALRSLGVPRAAARAETRRRLEDVGLQELAQRRPHQLSGGQAQRAAIARALAARPRLLLLDEPLSALDVDVSPGLRELLRRFLADRSALVVSHDALDAMTLADTTAVIVDGHVREQGPTMEVLTLPRSAFAARFAGLNLLHGTWDGTAVALPGHDRLAGGLRGGARPGDAVHAVFRPSAVELGSAPASAGAAAMAERSVVALEPHGDLVRVRTEDLAADLSPQVVAESAIRPGSRVHPRVAPEDVTIYPARRTMGP
ncbi:sulfate/molybdate ABC transporter ATP-binding protein [Brachybacterium sp. GCM10030267]|uniref:sulfate/molybdate ABC transporter ATP-binding protein n=1 Tax=unclassified Brachybacterium TaxID=2623841 RepID=UPI0036178DC0